ncbi:MAG: hypothetical protein IJX30_04945 [Clostridia bacterium]|nr:hypothetical protein [Clostridia bacterium]
MHNTTKKTICLLLTAFMGVACACGGETETSALEEAPNYTQSSYSFKTVFTDGIQKKLKAYNPDVPSENGNVTYDVYSNIGNKNYLKLEIETDVDLVGHITYYKNGESSVSNSEKFFVEANSTKFTTFLDAYRVGAQGAYEKTISTISFQNVDATKEGTFTFKSVGISDRTLDTNEQLYVSDGSTVLGTSPYYGGCITYLEKMDEDVYEYMDSDGNICIDRDVDPDFVSQVVSDKVNLVNIYDLGREIQPSYYSNVTEENGYTPDYDPEDKDSYYQGINESGKPIYNPIQCGDFGGHTPQIIDYEYASDRLYIKMKGQEWFFFTNIQANGYIEVTYYFDKTGALIVDNRYTDFSQFINVYDVAICSQETPATYFVYPLNYFYCETKQGVIFDKNVGEMNGRTQTKTSLRSAVTGDYVYGLKGSIVKNGWCAFVNENKFGVGIYLPNADRYSASRGRKSVSYFAEEANRKYHKDYFQFDESQIVPSYTTINYSYINPSLVRRMIDFVALEYSYALYIGDTDQMGEAFKELKTSGRLTNDHLTDETQGWPTK